MVAPLRITLKAARVNADLTQREAGEALGVTPDVISNWERGISFPDVAQVKAIEKAYNISYDNLIFCRRDTV